MSIVHFDLSSSFYRLTEVRADSFYFQIEGVKWILHICFDYYYFYQYIMAIWQYNSYNEYCFIVSASFHFHVRTQWNENVKTEDEETKKACIEFHRKKNNHVFINRWHTHYALIFACEIDSVNFETYDEFTSY